MRCEEFYEVVAGCHDGSAIVDDRALEHIESCLRCQAERAQYRRLARSMRDLQGVVVHPADDLNQSIFAILDDPDQLRAHGRSTRRAAYLSGLAAATAAGAAGALVIASRARSRRIAG